MQSLMRLPACPFPLTLDIKSSQANGTLMIQSIFSNLTDGLIQTSVHLIGRSVKMLVSWGDLETVIDLHSHHASIWIII